MVIDTHIVIEPPQFVWRWARSNEEKERLLTEWCDSFKTFLSGSILYKDVSIKVISDHSKIDPDEDWGQ